jgi:hypothetical protein
MSTITIKINERSKAGKMLKDFLELISDKPGIEIIEEKSPYNPEFVKKIKRAQKQKGTVVDTNDVWGSLGLK